MQEKEPERILVYSLDRDAAYSVATGIVSALALLVDALAFLPTTATLARDLRQARQRELALARRKTLRTRDHAPRVRLGRDADREAPDAALGHGLRVRERVLLAAILAVLVSTIAVLLGIFKWLRWV